MTTKKEGKQIVDILEEISPATRDGLVILFDETFVQIDSNIIAEASSIKMSCHLRDLRATAKVPSLNPAPLPEFELTDTDDQKILKAAASQ